MADRELLRLASQLALVIELQLVPQVTALDQWVTLVVRPLELVLVDGAGAQL